MYTADEIAGRLSDMFKKQSWQGTIVSIGRVKDLEIEIGTRHQKGLLDPMLFEKYLASFDFACAHRLADAQSLIIVGVPQPQVRIIFETQNNFHPVIIPPTYSFSTDQQVADILDSFFASTPYYLKKVRLPEKLLAVRSGLAQYGKNNISYIPHQGSFYRPVVFVSDLPCNNDSWTQPTVMAQCEECTACVKACLTKAIVSDRFQLHAERCLTFYNENIRNFPDWLHPAWHNSLVGCMICQKVCPANKAVSKWIETADGFDRKETGLILESAAREKLPRKTLEKLKRLDMMKYYAVLGRNLRVLIERKKDAPCNALITETLFVQI